MLSPVIQVVRRLSMLLRASARDGASRYHLELSWQVTVAVVCVAWQDGGRLCGIVARWLVQQRIRSARASPIHPLSCSTKVAHVEGADLLPLLPLSGRMAELR